MQDSVNKDRERYIGGSDIPIIMDLSPFKSRFDLLLEKAGYKANDFTGNIYTEYGNALEPVIRGFINSERATYDLPPFLEGKHVREAEADEIIGARLHTDGETDEEILEIKTTGEIHTDLLDYKLYLVQIVYYMVMTGKPYGLLAVYERPEDLSRVFDKKRLFLYRFTLEDEPIKALAEEIERAIERFIEDLAKVKANPFITESELLPAEIPDITEKILALESQIAMFKKVEATIKTEKDRLKKAMQVSGVKHFTTPNGYKITLVDDGEDKLERKFNESAFKTAEPELYDKYLQDKVVKGRSGYVLITPPKTSEEG